MSAARVEWSLAVGWFELVLLPAQIGTWDLETRPRLHLWRHLGSAGRVHAGKVWLLLVLHFSR